MINAGNSERVKRATPFCQATGCFEVADVYIVLKETEEPFSYDELTKDENYEQTKQPNEAEGFDGFKLILYFCARHDNEFKYLIKGSELEVAKRCYLDKLAGLRRVQPSSK